jgi:hypothetical protein
MRRCPSHSKHSRSVAPRHPRSPRAKMRMMDCATSARCSIWNRALLAHSPSTKGLEEAETPGPSKCYRSDDDPAYLGRFYYVKSLDDRLSRVTHCKPRNFLRQTTADPSKGTYKLLAICSSESYLFEPPKKNTRGRPERRPLG